MTHAELRKLLFDVSVGILLFILACAAGYGAALTNGFINGR